MKPYLLHMNLFPLCDQCVRRPRKRVENRHNFGGMPRKLFEVIKPVRPHKSGKMFHWLPNTTNFVVVDSSGRGVLRPKKGNRSEYMKWLNSVQPRPEYIPTDIDLSKLSNAVNSVFDRIGVMPVLDRESNKENESPETELPFNAVKEEEHIEEESRYPRTPSPPPFSQEDNLSTLTTDTVSPVPPLQVAIQWGRLVHENPEASEKDLMKILWNKQWRSINGKDIILKHPYMN